MRKLTLAMVAIGILVVVGGAAAASKYLITNIHQIKPSVRAQLRGHQGQRGVQGPSGPQGPAGLTSVKTVVGQVVDAAPCCTNASIIQATAQCPAGTVAVAGGWVGDPNHTPAVPFFLANAPSSASAWTVLMVNGDNQNTAGIGAVVTCALGGLAGAADTHISRAGSTSVTAELAAARRLVRARAVALESTQH